MVFFFLPQDCTKTEDLATRNIFAGFPLFLDGLFYSCWSHLRQHAVVSQHHHSVLKRIPWLWQHREPTVKSQRNLKHPWPHQQSVLTADHNGPLMDKLFTKIDYLCQGSSNSVKVNFPLMKWIESDGCLEGRKSIWEPMWLCNNVKCIQFGINGLKHAQALEWCF